MHLVKSIDCNLLSFPSVGASELNQTDGQVIGMKENNLNCRISNQLHQEPMIAENDVEAE